MVDRTADFQNYDAIIPAGLFENIYHLVTHRGFQEVTTADRRKNDVLVVSGVSMQIKTNLAKPDQRRCDEPHGRACARINRLRQRGGDFVASFVPRLAPWAKGKAPSGHKPPRRSIEEEAR